MKTSVSWLSRYVDIPWNPAELAEKLTLAGLEVEGIDPYGKLPEGIVVGKILTREPHPNADRLSVCTVDAGTGTPLGIVCGAPNCDPGLKVPVAMVGATLAPGFTIKKTKLRGVPSEGMLCAEDELGLGTDHNGLLILPEDAVPGTPLDELFPNDTVIDWEITPNRPDWLSHVGIAREIAAVAGKVNGLRLPETDYAEDGTPVEDLTSVDVLDPDLCPRYTARVVRNITIGPSPEWMQRALKSVGLRPINNVVDITNYVMLECGQPLHAFDYDRLAGHRIVVRRATDGETMVTLDGKSHKLTRDNLLICDGEKGVALAGVMGGENSEIADTTTTVLLESAAFNPTNIRATARNLEISTDSSYRFERGVDIEMTEFASRRAVALMCSLAGGVAATGLVDVYAAPYEPRAVEARHARINSLIGVEIPRATSVSFLELLGLEVSDDGERVRCLIPPYRGDLVREADLIEEIARLYGLDNIPGTPAKAKSGGMRADDTYYRQEEARAQLRGLGLQETMTYSFTSVAAATRCTGVTEDQLVGPANPLSQEIAVMRPNLVPALIQTTGHNIARASEDLAFFEMGRVLVHAPDFPEERLQIGIAITGRRHPERFGAEKDEVCDFYDMKGILEGWFRARRLSPVCRAHQHDAFRRGACAAMCINDTVVAVFGEACEGLTADIRLRNPLFLALVEPDRLREADVRPMVYSPLPQFPAIVRDISLVAPATLEIGAVIDSIVGMNIPCLEQVELFDVYADEKALGPGRRSLAYSVTYRNPERTLTDREVNELHERVRNGLARQSGVELR